MSTIQTNVMIPEVMLNLMAQQTIWTTSMNNLTIQDSQSLTIDAKTVLNEDLGGIGAFIGIWSGLAMISDSNNFLGKTELTGVSGGEFANKQLKITAPGQSLLTDTFTIGLFLRGNDLNSLSASVHVSAGNPFSYQQTNIFVLNATTRNISVQYRVPNFIDPSQRLDWLYLLKSSEPVMDNSGALSHEPIAKPDPNGVVNIPVSGIRFEPGEQYVVQYNPGNYIDTVSAGYTFTQG